MSTTNNKKTQQYVAIEVPHSTPTKDADQSYLRMGNLPGAHESPSSEEPGDKDIIQKEDLLTSPPDWEANTLHQAFIANDSKMRTGGDQAPIAPKNQWLDDLGWRDHCHGNRVTTTHGDKIEVITGNYKLVVLGGQDGTKSTGLDMSGGHTVDWGRAPGSIRNIEYNGDSGGDELWRVTTLTRKGDEVDIYDGKTFEHVTGGESNSACRYVGKGDYQSLDQKLAPTQSWLGLVRDTTYAKLKIEENLGEEIFSVDAGSTPKDFNEASMADKPAEADAASILSHYGMASKLREIKVADKLDEVVRANHITVDYQVVDIVEKWQGSYAEKFTGPQRTFDTRTELLEEDRHESMGKIASKFLCLLREEATVSAQYTEAQAAAIRTTLSSNVMDTDIRAALVSIVDSQSALFLGEGKLAEVVHEMVVAPLVMEDTLGLTLSVKFPAVVDVLGTEMSSSEFAVKLCELLAIA